MKVFFPSFSTQDYCYLHLGLYLRALGLQITMDVLKLSNTPLKAARKERFLSCDLHGVNQT